MKVGDKVSASYGRGIVLEINEKIAKIKFESQQVPIEMHIDYVKTIPEFKINQLLKYRNNYCVVIEVSGDYAKLKSVSNQFNTSQLFERISLKEVEFVKCIEESIVYNGVNFKIGIDVKNDKYGIGNIVSLFESYALIKYGDNFRLISYKFLEIVGSELDEEIVEIEYESKDFYVIPSNYSDSEYYSTAAKNILTWSKKHFASGLASIQSYTDNKKTTTGLIIVKDKGVIIYKIFDGVTNANIDFGLQSATLLYEDDRVYTINKFLNSKTLCMCTEDGKSKILKFPLKYVYLFQNVKFDDLTIEQKNKLKAYDYIYCRNFKSNNTLFSKYEPYYSGFIEIEYKLYSNILERVIPENCTLLLENKSVLQSKKINNTNRELKMVPITGHEREFVALQLDDDEIRFINNTKPGHWITLANPGTGKSVVLLSKAYRLANINNNSKIMITCFNNNLCEHHMIFSERTGLRTSGLFVSKFFQMIFQLLEEYRINTKELKLITNDDARYEKAIDLLFNYVSKPNFVPIFDAIFIDEVQLFKPKWIKLCKKMLKENGYFELYGDLNQNVRTSEIGLKSPWKDKTLALNWTGHTRYLNKNYRNTQKINDYLNNLINNFNKTILELKPDFEIEDTKLTSRSSKDNKREVQIFNCTEDNIHKMVAHLINEINSKWHIEYDDIAILFPASHLGVYKPFEKIKNALDVKGISNCQIFGTSDVKSKLNDTNGVIFSTIDSSLGLDFKVVILCGTAYWNYFWENGQRKSLTSSVLKTGNECAITKYCEIGRKIYSACSRAREGLIIVDDLPTLSPVKKILKK